MLFMLVSITFMSPESTETSLTQNIVPVYHDIDANCGGSALRLNQNRSTGAPLTNGGKFGLPNALRSYDDILDTRFPRYNV